ncbi:MAG: hypothetical protein ACI8YI_000513 [Paracoccaceae bacterium]|jgi:hypothetical protein
MFGVDAWGRGPQTPWDIYGTKKGGRSKAQAGGVSRLGGTIPGLGRLGP